MHSRIPLNVLTLAMIIFCGIEFTTFHKRTEWKMNHNDAVHSVFHYYFPALQPFSVIVLTENLLPILISCLR